MMTDKEKAASVTKFLLNTNVFKILKFLSQHPEGMDLQDIAEGTKLSMPTVLAVIHEAWRFGIVEPFNSPINLEQHQGSSEDSINAKASINSDSVLDSSIPVGSPLLRDLPLHEFLDQQFFLSSAIKEINEKMALKNPHFDPLVLSPLMKTSLDHRMKSGLKTRFHLTPWAQELIDQVSSVEEMNEVLKQRGLLG